MDWLTLEGTIEEIYENIDKYKDGLGPKAKEKGFGYLLKTRNGKIVVIADKDLLMLGLAKIGNRIKVMGWFNDKGVFLATATIGSVDKEKFDEIKPKLVSLFEE